MKNKIIEELRKRFLYDYKGKPLLLDYGSFKAGLIKEEIDDYLKVRTNSLNISKINKQFYKEMRGSTCVALHIEKLEIILCYRHDVERFADVILDKKETYFD